MPNLTEVELLINKLIRLSTSCLTPVDSDERAVFLNDYNKSIVKEIGERLNEIGGYKLMLFAYDSIPKYDQLELSYAWHGIGGWIV